MSRAKLTQSLKKRLPNSPSEQIIKGTTFMTRVHGAVVDDKTRCAHYHLVLDIIAIKFKCCGRYYPCYQCHEEISGHSIQRWRRDELKSGHKVILCGECKKTLTFDEYSNNGAKCLCCDANFNPKCALHYDLYFDLS
ncbi:Uncharacterized protein, contains Zn-finger domain of CHY type [Metschnikowia aff. pulcherrima]|uniref:Uncharacterized protein, contains Zn-finger domain of CHY type n=1 Tax=Metschnikowia aff. pulcherrima TaxID=2163413 RepID=A0A4P6XM16_9ASCO|nr:Uncharacterized protein, contains Zn-finger domain of CHY type [Metschnikowia aff. pulcherrima]